MLHIYISNREAGALRHHRLAGAGLRSRVARRRWPSVADGEPATSTCAAVGGDDVLGQPHQDPRDFSGGWTKSGDKYLRNADGTFTYAAAAHDTVKVSGIYVSPFEVEATLVQHPAVLEAAVIARRMRGPDKTRPRGAQAADTPPRTS